jgi:two-component system cell cycle response regulator CpdR
MLFREDSMPRILIAEDDTGMRQFLAAALKRAGHETEACADGMEALDLIRSSETPFDLLLADIVMPGMDGIELSQKATALHPTMKVMFITGFAGVALEAKAEQRPVMSKPFHLKELVDQVESLLAAAPISP